MVHVIEVAVMFLFLAAIVGGAVAAVRFVIKPTSVPWWIASLLPVVPVAIAATGILIGVSRDRTSHNLWPFEIVIASVMGAVLLGVVFAARKVLSRRA